MATPDGKKPKEEEEEEDLISRLIRRNHSITNIFRIKLSRDLVFVSIPTFSLVRISNKLVKYSHRPPKVENQHGGHIYSP